jgi:hypothetical protein
MIARSGATLTISRSFRQRPSPFSAIDLLGAKSANLPAPRPRQKLQLQNVRCVERKCVGIQPLPERLDFLDGQDPIAGHTEVIRLKTGGGVRLNDVLRQRPAEHCCANLPTFFRLPPLAPINDRVQDRPYVTSANICSISLKDGRQCAPQTALNRLGCAQAADNSPSQIKVDQLLDPNPRGCRVSGLALFADQVTATARRAGEFIGPLARLLEADVGRSAER